MPRWGKHRVCGDGVGLSGEDGGEGKQGEARVQEG